MNNLINNHMKKNYELYAVEWDCRLCGWYCCAGFLVQLKFIVWCFDGVTEGHLIESFAELNQLLARSSHQWKISEFNGWGGWTPLYSLSHSASILFCQMKHTGLVQWLSRHSLNVWLSDFLAESFEDIYTNTILFFRKEHSHKRVLGNCNWYYLQFRCCYLFRTRNCILYRV